METALGETQRALWLQARTSISEYERQACELQLDLQHEQKELQTSKDHLASIRKGEIDLELLSYG